MQRFRGHSGAFLLTAPKPKGSVPFDLSNIAHFC
jgi:hypothetical protein